MSGPLPDDVALCVAKDVAIDVLRDNWDAEKARADRFQALLNEATEIIDRLLDGGDDEEAYSFRARLKEGNPT